MSGVNLARSTPFRQASIILHPHYFYSSTFVNDARIEIDLLLRAFADIYKEDNVQGHPFTIFKTLWCGRKLDHLYLQLLDPRADAQRLHAWSRLFLERLSEDSDDVTHAAMLFSLYTLVKSQPLKTATDHRIAIPYDSFVLLTQRTGQPKDRLSCCALHALYELVDAQVFCILSHSSTHPFSPLNLPESVLSNFGYTRKPGRHNKTDKLARATTTAGKLEDWVIGMTKEGTVSQVQDTPDEQSTRQPRNLSYRHSYRPSLIRPPAVPCISGATRIAPRGSEGPLRFKSAPDTPTSSGPMNPLYYPPNFQQYLSAKNEVENIGANSILADAENATRRNLKGVEKYASSRGMNVGNGWAGARFIDGRRGLLDLVSADTDRQLTIDALSNPDIDADR
ncbi:hypothetical protein FRC03_004103 [Tulasnella sp. 419]|nr:hypothetical protein FRC02_008145 [Tulasnella sp. 418]KAG8970721.1 hypothetical protein FRC03_004103 [Tulasnella sp. 419]